MARPYESDTPILSRGIVIRDNALSSQAVIEATGGTNAGPTISGLLIERNRIAHVADGLTLGESVENVLAQNNESSIGALPEAAQKP